jgi:predicted GH43/DUF377 family glycosyl hydrolase
MRWDKRGRIFLVDRQFPWMASHASVATPHLLDDGRLRIYFGARDTEGRSRPGFIDVNADDPRTVHHLHERPVLELGKLGAFDDNGVMPSCVLDVGGESYLYYIGWTPASTVPYKLAIGLAVSTDGGITFVRMHEGPVVDRSPSEPYFTTAPCVLHEGGTWRMWYVSTTRWTVVHDRPEPVYEIKYAESSDGVRWERPNVTCIAPRSPTEAVGRPWVLRGGGTYAMWYSYRDIVGYRTVRRQSYRIGYAESVDGLSWSRMDEEAGIGVSDEGWDSEMIEYPAVYEHDGTRHLIYNGNGFGESGIGHAVLEAGRDPVG